MDRVEASRVLAECGRLFELEGFEVPARGRIYRPLEVDALGWVGLNTSTSISALEIWPNVGIHHVAVMQMVSRLQGRKYVKGDVATYAVSLGSIAPGEGAFKFLDGGDSRGEARRLVDTVVTHALPWMKRIGSLDEVIPLLRQREDMLGGVPERIAVALHLLGRKDDVLAYLAQRQACYDSDVANPGVASSWRRFAEALISE